MAGGGGGVNRILCLNGLKPFQYKGLTYVQFTPLKSAISNVIQPG